LSEERQRLEPRAEVGRVRDVRDARVATTLFALAVGAVLAVAGLETLGLVMAAVAGAQALAAGYAQVRLWRLRVQRLAEVGSPAG